MWICSQIGAREHYAVPRALHKSGRLAALFTDFWAGPVVRKLADGRLRPLAARFHPELVASGTAVSTLHPAPPPDRGGEGTGFATGAEMTDERRKAEIVSWNLRALWWERILRRSRKPENRGSYHGFIEVGSRFAIRVRESLKRRTDLKPDSIFFAYDTGALETMEWCRERGVKCVLNQMDPNRTEAELVRAEEKQWPGWAAQPAAAPEEYFQRREREWALADRIVVNSEYCRQALLRQGVPSGKLAVVPLCYEARAEKRKAESRNEFQISGSSISTFSPLRVLFLGQVILRKGIQYLTGAAKLLSKENIHFDVVGPVGISRDAVASAPGNVTFHGRAGRDQAADWYRRSHLFVLPTISDGFAITQLEAMAHGLPVIATPCCGEVVSDGADGFIVPPRDAGALARTFRRYLAEPDLLNAQRKAALEKSRQFTPGRLAENLTRLEEGLKIDTLKLKAENRN